MLRAHYFLQNHMSYNVTYHSLLLYTYPNTQSLVLDSASLSSVEGRSLLKILNSIGASIDPWIQAPVGHHATDHNPMSPTLQSVVSPPHCSHSSPYLISLSMRILYDSFKHSTKIEIKNIHYSSLMHQAIPVIAEGYQLYQA